MKTKIIAITVLIILMLSSTVLAKPIIKSDNTYFDFSTGLYVLNGNVYVQVNNRIITADQAKVSIASLEVWGSGNITVTQDDIYFTGNTVYVSGTNNTAQIDGGVNFSRSNLKITADKVSFNWKTKIASFSGNVQLTQNGQTSTFDNLNYDVVNNTTL